MDLNFERTIGLVFKEVGDVEGLAKEFVKTYGAKTVEYYGSLVAVGGDEEDTVPGFLLTFDGFGIRELMRLKFDFNLRPDPTLKDIYWVLEG